MSVNHSTLIQKLDEFIRKYYINQLLKGLIWCGALLLTYFLILVVLEYFAYFNSLVRTILFYSYILTSVIVLYVFVFTPILKLYRLGKIISYETAASIIGTHFSEIKDKLLNTLQLIKISTNPYVSSELLEAGIEQKIQKLSPIPFSTAIDFKINKKYLKYLLPPLVVFFTILIASPSVVFGPSKRYMNYSVFYEKEAPFKFQILNDKLVALQQQDYKLQVKLTGNDIPAEVFLVRNENEYKLNKENIILFNYTFKNIQEDITFYFSADGYRSQNYSIKVIPKPIILDFEIQLNYPSYTGKKNEIIENSGDVSVPCGTRVSWKIKTKDTKKLFLKLAGKNLVLDPAKEDLYSYSHSFYETQSYTIIPQNQYVKNIDSLTYSINVVPDSYPSVDVEEYRDSLFFSRIYFKGIIKDDYGFSTLLFKYKKVTQSEGDEDEKEMFQAINVNKFITQSEFYHFFDVSSLNVEGGDNIEYYFEVWDNDAINGSKAARSSKKVFKIPTEQEIQEQTEKDNEEVKNKIEQALSDIKQLQNQIEEIDKKLIDKKTLNWQERKQIEDILQKQQQLHQNVEDLKEQFKQNNIREQQFQKADSTLLEKQKQLEELFDKIMSDEMKDLFQKMQELLDKLDKSKIDEMLDKIKMSNKDLEKDLDRNLELFKALEFDKKLTETIEKLQQLAEEQKKLSDETKNENNDKNKLIEEQKKIDETYQNIRKDIKSLEEQNKELEIPKDLKNTDQQQNSIQNELNNSKEELQNNKRKNASKSQQSAGEQMENLANELEQMQQEMEQEELAEDERALRMILKNLIKISFSQEGLIEKIRSTKIYDPKYISIMDKQKELKDGLKMVEDSLLALSKRQAIIQPIVNREITSINDNVDKTLEALHNRNTPQVQKWQQYVMTSVNNLALLLAEALEQIRQEMESSCNSSCNKKGGMKCKKQGKGNPSAATMKKLQEQLNKQIEDLKNQMQSGQKPGGKDGQKSISEQLARLAAEQEAIRKMLQQYGEELKKDGTGNDGNISEMMKKMEQTETDLVNKMLSNETLKRQQEILTRLLDSEKAEKERELDEKRKSNEAIEKIYTNPKDFFEYNKIKSNDIELLKTIPVTLTPFFKYKTNEYFYKFED